jgi:hypothetical protein
MTDWTTISSLATAGATLALAVATFASVRSANQAARTAERALEARLRPVLLSSRLEDPPQKVTWVDEYKATIGGGRGVADVGADGTVYLAMSVRNVGAGMAVLHGWWPRPEVIAGVRANLQHEDPERFRRLTRDLYVPPGDIGFFQGAVRDADDPVRGGLPEAIGARRRFGIDVLYGDHEGGQRTISSFTLTPVTDGSWLCTVARHWNLDRPDPR